MSKAADIFRQSSSDAAILVTAPKCSDSEAGVGAGAVTVEPDRYETINVSPERRGNPLLRFLESGFGKDRSVDTEAMEELEDMSNTVKVVSPTGKREVVGGFDICREYSYDSGDECDHDDDDGVDTSTSREKLAEPLLRSYVLGKTYHPINDYASRRDDESSLFWFTYRCDFHEIAPYAITSDAGWGCMLRSAQMLLAQTLKLHFRSRDWKTPQSLARRRQDPFVRSMLTWFADFPSTTEFIYSLHNMVAAGVKYDKLPGEWHGPQSACYVLHDLVELHERQQTSGKVRMDRKMFRVHVASNGSVYRDAIDKLMTRDSASQLQEQRRKVEQENPPAHPLDLVWEDELVESEQVQWDTALLLLIPLRLGLKSFNQDYVEAVAHTFSLPQSVGVLGGRPRGARWFYGAISDGSKILGLDPHTVQSSPRQRVARVNGKLSSVVEMSDDYLRSVHTTYQEVYSLNKMDPSIALGFYCRNRKELESVFSNLKTWKQANPTSPDLFTVGDASPNYSSGTMNDMMSSQMSGSLMDADDDQSSDEDEYVIL